MKKLSLFFSVTITLCMTPTFANHKDHTFMVFMERNNDLNPFGDLNIAQMKKVGSNKNINIVVYMHYAEGKTKKTKVLFIRKNEAIVLKETPENKKMFNIQQELISFCNNTIKAYPANHYSLIFWNHGTGATEPCNRRKTSNLFKRSSFQEERKTQHTIKAFRNIKKHKRQTTRGICFDDSEGTFLSEKELLCALKKICATSLCNKKFDLIGFDACLMAMIEIGSGIKEYATLMVGSQEVELGTGWNYARVLAPFEKGSISPRALSKHIVHSYAKTYYATADFTQSALDLNHIDELENNVHSVAQKTSYLVYKDPAGQLLEAIRVSRNKHLCTHFDEPDFIDLQHFYKNFLKNISNIVLQEEKSNKLLALLKTDLTKGQSLIQKIIIANKSGVNRSQASGISIYFPERYIHPSYHSSPFTLSNAAWIGFLQAYLSW